MGGIGHRLRRGASLTIGVLIAVWFLVPVVIVLGFLVWATFAAPWAWKPLFAAVLVVIAAASWGAVSRRRAERGN